MTDFTPARAVIGFTHGRSGSPRWRSPLAFAATLLLASCGGNGSGAPASSGGKSGGGGGATASGGASASTGGATGAGGTGGSFTTATGGAGSGGATGGTTGGSGGLTTAGTGGAASGGRASGGGGGSASGGRAGGGGGSAGRAGTGGGDGASSCSRELLKGTVDAYFVALTMHSSAALPLAATVKFTENGKVLKVGEGGLWKTAGALKYAHSALDTTGCNTASEAVIMEGSIAIPFALRLKLSDQKITEIETIAVRPGDYKLSGTTYASNTDAIIASAASVKWEEVVPAGQRNTREEIMAWVDKYFRIFPRGVCNTVSTCKRLENGFGSFECSAGASCAPGPAGTGTPVIPFHIIFADVETGIGVGFDLFMGNTDMHMVKMYGGQVYAVHAILGGATSTGWD